MIEPLLNNACFLSLSLSLISSITPPPDPQITLPLCCAADRVHTGLYCCGSSETTTAWSPFAAALGSSKLLLTEKYEQGVELVKSLEVPPIGAYVSEAGSKASEKIGLLGASAVSAFGWIRWPSFNFTWNEGEKNYFYGVGGGGGGGKAAKVVEERIVEKVTVVHDWSKADLSGLRDELRKELKLYVDGLMVEKDKQWEAARRGLSSEEVDNLMNLLLEKLRAGDYFKLDLTQENFRAIFLEMRQRFLDDNEVFVSRLVESVQGSLDLSSWEDKLAALKLQILGTKGDVTRVAEDLERMKKEMTTHDDLGALKEALMAYINEMIKQKVTEVIEVHLVNVQRKAEVSAGSKSEASDASIATLANEDEVRRLIVGALKVYDADKTGLADYALESSGGQVMSTRCTENYHTKSAQISVFGIPLWYPSNTPRTAIQPNVLPGNCWAFQGFPGFLGELRAEPDLF